MERAIMIRARSLVCLLSIASAVSACGGGWWPIGRTSDNPSARIPSGATEYACANDRRLLVRYSADGNSAWVIYPDREFRLDRTASGADERFSNGVSTLSKQGDEAMLEESGTRLFVDCKRKQAGS